MSIDRFSLVRESFEKKAVPAEKPEKMPSEYFGELVFDRRKMAEYLDESTLAALLDCVDNGKPLDRATADKFMAQGSLISDFIGRPSMYSSSLIRGNIKAKA